MIAYRALKEVVPVEAAVGLIFVIVLFGATSWVYLKGREHGRGSAAEEIAALKFNVQTLTQATESAEHLESVRQRFAAAKEAAYKAALRQSESALQTALRAKKEADDELASWQRKWGRRSPSCAAALSALDTACPELGKY